ncbi:peptidoglycan DD-metalloendopeptidase family protein [Alkalihalobacillus hemicellulosilyticus]|uniref:N-acetylmuramoyl-L-alanine amidase xlyB n=1 Tax=Halalkalibacter hemicellulosilyticusJCM 9152 TaxID=1236971 RepID=W4QMB3_9BACI|nr:peptidoglycan DD-metalloendopeptidase family protein [Halalkalibacter hemicellulosilyticus]GAE32459.1 N-acetylmuramoyl-L-alanine amidase xlyB precursor [Halalkalibacter hemicellulosilyticusJCM 9152]
MSTFIWPTDTKRITSGFRTSSRPDHHGIDIAEAGARPIFAVANGTVSRSYVSESYGEVIFITHQVNGQTWETVYAHLRTGSRGFSVGQTVRKGQQIGIMGNTGRSFGQHLHFELHRGRWNIEKSNAVNPVDYLEKNLTPSTSSNVLRKGDSGVAVKELQEELISLGYDLGRWGADGKFGDATEKAVRAFQKDARIKVDGVPGPQTFSALEKALSKKQSKTLYLPGSAASWRVYPLDKAPTVGNESGRLNPAKFGGLSYEILDNPQAHVYTIQTRDFGKVNIYAGPDTSATIK